MFWGRCSQGRFQGVKMEPNGPTWTNMEPKEHQKGAQSSQNVAKGSNITLIFVTRSGPKYDQNCTPKYIFRKGRFRDTRGHSGYSGLITFFPERCWTMKDFRSFLGTPKQLKVTEKQDRNIYLKNGEKTMARRGKMLLFRLTCYKIWGFGGLEFLMKMELRLK